MSRPKNYECLLCGHRASCFGRLKTHLHSKHQAEPIANENCKFHGKPRQNKPLRPKNYECLLCGHRASCFGRLKTHLHSKHQAEPIANENLKRHGKLPQNKPLRPKNYECVLCPSDGIRKFRELGHLKTHLRNEHQFNMEPVEGKDYKYNGKERRPRVQRDPVKALKLSRFVAELRRVLCPKTQEVLEPIFTFLSKKSRRIPQRSVDVPENCREILLRNIIGQRQNPIQTVSTHHGEEFKSQEELDDVLAKTLQSLSNPKSVSPTVSIWSVPNCTNGSFSEWTQRTATALGEAFSIQLEGNYTATWSPPGHISPWHYDQLNGGTALVELWGDKLFIAFPPTRHNLEIFPLDAKFTTLQESIEIFEKLEDIYWFTLGPGDEIVLEPGHGHMVISANEAAVGGWPCSKVERETEIERLVCEDRKLGSQKQKQGGPKGMRGRKRT